MAILRAESVPILADALHEYIPHSDLAAMCALFSVTPPGDGILISYIAVAQVLVFEAEVPSHRRLLESLLSTAKTRCMDRVARTAWERREYHQTQLERIVQVERELAASGAPAELVVPEARPFAAKSELRQTLATAETEVVIIDNYIGPGTLDCLIEVPQPVRLLTGSHAQAIAAGFDRAMSDYVAEGRSLLVRRHPRLHDRHITFNGRCWILGSSIKDAGKKSFNMVEIVDCSEAVVADIEKKWSEATPYKP